MKTPLLHHWSIGRAFGHKGVAIPSGSMLEIIMALHFVGFSDDRYWTALRVFGRPDFFHRVWDHRARQEVVAGDMAVFANGTADDPTKLIGWDDSQQDILARGGKEYFL